MLQIQIDSYIIDCVFEKIFDSKQNKTKQRHFSIPIDLTIRKTETKNILFDIFYWNQIC